MTKANYTFTIPDPNADDTSTDLGDFEFDMREGDLYVDGDLVDMLDETGPPLYALAHAYYENHLSKLEA